MEAAYEAFLARAGYPGSCGKGAGARVLCRLLFGVVSRLLTRVVYAMEFHELFSKATDGLEPFPFQRRIAAEGFPQTLCAPTGAGKSAAAVLGWLWRRRFAPDDETRRRTPRRLVYCLPMRVLVEQVRDSAAHWVERLGLAEDVSVHTLMGGEVSVDWDRDPERDAILVGTQDQLLSRALNRGYAMSRYRFPVHFALLSSDALWVMDEVQLMGPGLSTSVQLDAFRRAFGAFGPSQAMWMSATLRRDLLATVDAPDWADPLALSDADRSHPSLAPRLEARKALAALGLACGPKGYEEALAAEVCRRHRPGTLTLVIVNTIRRAQELFNALASGRKPLAGDVSTTLLHSSFRPPDRAEALARLTAPVANDGPGLIAVATQAVEAGVDISAATLITELAPWDSLVQRFGRCNRRGEYEEAQVYWADVGAKQAAPYAAEDLERARARLEALKEAGIRTVQGIPDDSPPPIHPMVRRRDVVDLYDTTPDLSGQDVDVSIYIREQDDHDLSVFWREFEGEPPAEIAAPEPSELCPVGVGRLRNWHKKKPGGNGKPAYVWDHLDAKWTSFDAEAIRPGLTVLLPASAGAYDPARGWWEDAKGPVPVVIVERQVHSAGYDANPLSEQHVAVTLADHTDAVVRELKCLLDRLGDIGLSEEERSMLEVAARWHDAGKAHPEFQRRLRGEAPDDGVILAKAPVAGATSGERPRFRHELASALAGLANGIRFEAAYLAACHHGKVRMSIRSMPDEKTAPDEVRYARGVWEGDILPQADLGAGVVMPQTTLSLECMELGVSESGEPSWLDRSAELLAKYGPFRLAYLEALLRIADWRASAETGGGAYD